jgi:hypothetical protein
MGSGVSPTLWTPQIGSKEIENLAVKEIQQNLKINRFVCLKPSMVYGSNPPNIRFKLYIDKD